MSFTDSIYLVFLAAGFTVGFGHCIGMCGPIVVSFCLGLGDRNRFVPNIFYNAGRTATYTILGGVLGAGGSFTGVVVPMAGFQKGVMILAGGLIAVMGLAMTGWMTIPRIFSSGYFPIQKILNAFRKLSNASGFAGFFAMGLLLGLLLCGPVYTALLSAVRVGMDADGLWQGAFSGAMVMLVFGAGTIPALLLISMLSDVKWLKHRKSVYRVGGIMMAIAGIYFLVKGIMY
jgi:sulfite exporter TauE/SafE